MSVRNQSKLNYIDKYVSPIDLWNNHCRRKFCIYSNVSKFAFVLTVLPNICMQATLNFAQYFPTTDSLDLIEQYIKRHRQIMSVLCQEMLAIQVEQISSELNKVDNNKFICQTQLSHPLWLSLPDSNKYFSNVCSIC